MSTRTKRTTNTQSFPQHSQNPPASIRHHLKWFFFFFPPRHWIFFRRFLVRGFSENAWCKVKVEFFANIYTKWRVCSEVSDHYSWQQQSKAQTRLQESTVGFSSEGKYQFYQNFLSFQTSYGRQLHSSIIQYQSRVHRCQHNHINIVSCF